MKVLLAGGGIGGLTTAIALARAGIDAAVYEQASAIRPVGAGISLWPNATRVLQRLGLLREIVRRGCPIERVHLLNTTGAVLSETTAPSRFEVPSLCIHRADLHTVLRDALAPGVLHLGRRVERFEQEATGVTAFLSDGTTASADVLVGCDGLHSAVRAQLVGSGPPVYRGYPVWRGVVGFDLPSHPTGLATESWGRGRRFGIFRTGGGRVYWYATANEPPEQPAAAESSRAKLLRLLC